MPNLINTGNETVDLMGQMNLTGNITPANWYKTILRDNGKPYLLAIAILSEICYWYRPSGVRDEQSGFVTHYKKKFAEDYLQKSYQQLAEQFGESKRSVKVAMDCLEKLGVIKRIWETRHTEFGGAINNVLYIDLVVDKLYELTFEEAEKEPENQGNTRVTKNCNMPPQNNVGTHTKKSTTSGQKKVGVDSPKRDTNTKSTTKNTDKDYTEIKTEISNKGVSYNPIPSDHDYEENSDQYQKTVMERMEETRELIKENIDYAGFTQSGTEFDVEQIDQLIELMVGACVLGGDLTIGGRTIPINQVRARFEKYDGHMMEYVLYSLAHNGTKVKNTRKYLLATLYNAPDTIRSFYKLNLNYYNPEMKERDWYDRE